MGGQGSSVVAWRSEGVSGALCGAAGLPYGENGPAMNPAQQHAALITLAGRSPWLMEALAAVRELGLEQWCIGAGAIRNLVWDALHGHAQPSALSDVDVAVFEPLAPGPAAEQLARAQARDAQLQARLQARLPGLPWEVTNQAAVHLWFEDCFGHAVAPLGSLEEAVASWPEYATAVGLRLAADGALQVIAPLGLDDLFAMRVQRNPRRVSLATYARRVASKRYAERWPRVQVLPAD